MPWQVEPICDGNVILIEFLGDITQEDLRQATFRGCELARASGRWDVLVDASRVRRGVPLGDVYQMPKLYEELDVPRSLCIGAVPPPNPELRAQFRFFETILKNRGYNIELFPERPDAERWISSGRP